MASFIIKGGLPLSGELRIHGAKNAALPILAASILASGEQEISDVPKLLDIRVMIEILNHLGVKVTHKDHTVSLQTSTLSSTRIPEPLMGKMRSSIFLMGPLLAKYGEVTISRPGGCAIGERPIDIHLDGLKKLGADIIESHGTISCRARQLTGAQIFLRFPSVGATENLMMAASLAKGTTTISNAAREPEIVDLQDYLNVMGARVRGAGTDQIIIEGVEHLTPVSYKIIPDRIIAGTLLIATAITRGEVALTNVRAEHLQALLTNLQTSGIEIRTYNDIMTLKVSRGLRSIDLIETDPHPGFPTDLQALMMAYLSTVEGTSVVKEKVFEGRFRHVDELNRMGTNISTDLNRAYIRGVSRLSGAMVEATDLRAGAALVIAGLKAEGETIVENIHHIDRGYEKLEGMLQALGADIRRSDES
ncbi:UDP-N-acetylglucosamine 1-carboxyvinyltransferase [Caldalkalibacillus salinus]|uniref:UDP-N-acetylglucosamine 1-carboxyvinyltransferase n=1 Tax=Caldalkalibacillus salinus TaxID=2803787 RepID=UPI00192362D2|nr:UDP-N-acetylglucosamine 1-carboxyvinyltransferase [Caldalkalibacillus salinus]